jgi:signal transduction histidine kinase
VFADENMIKTILRNLISNAIKFSYMDGTIVLKIISNGDYTEITISDSGTGISEENMGKLFKIDSNFTTKGTSEEKGTGIGLALCKELVEKCHGKICVESEIGKGSKFIFTIPMKEQLCNE